MERVLTLLLVLMMSFNVSAQEVTEGIERHKGDNGLYGFVNKNDEGRMPWFKRAKRVSFGLLGIGGGSKTEMLNHGYDDEWVISAQYEDASKDFSEGLAAVQLRGKVGFVDSLNRFIIEPKFEPVKHLQGFSLGLAAVKINGKYGFINKKGVLVIKPVYEYAENFRDCKLATVKKDGKFGAINLNGELVVPCKFVVEEAMINVPLSNKPYREAKEKAAEDFKLGKFAKQLSVIRAAEQEVDAIIGNPAKKAKQPQKFAIKEESGGKGTCLADGSCVLSPIYDDIVLQPDNLLFVSDQDKWGVCDGFGRTILAPVYDIVSYERQAGVLVVQKDEKIGLFNTAGRMLLPPCLDGLDRFINGKAIAYINYENGLVDTNGELSDDLMQHAFNKVAKQDEDGAPAISVRPLYNQILLARPDYAMAHNNIGIMEIECKEYKEGMNRLKVANKLEPENGEIAANLKQAKKDRNNRRWNRVLTALEVAGAVVAVAATTYAAVEGAKGGASSSGASGGYSGSSGGGDCSQILSEISRYEAKLGNEQSSVDTKSARAAGKNAAHSIAPEYADGATAGDMRVINSSKKLVRTYQKRVNELKARARKKGCL